MNPSLPEHHPGLQNLLGLMVHSGVEAEVIKQFVDYLQFRRYGAKEIIFNENDEHPPIAYIVKGYVKITTSCPTGDEVVRYLSGPGNFAACSQALLFGARCHYTASCLTDCQVILISRRMQQTLLEWVSIRIAIQNVAIRRLEFLMEEKATMLPMRATERYRFFQQRYPEITKNVSATVIANYIGIQPQSLSRIKQKMK
jgi:CRP-like cAMP-binding protein